MTDTDDATQFGADLAALPDSRPDRGYTRHAVIQLVRDLHGAGVFTWQPVWPGAHSTERRPSPDLELQAAVTIRDAVGQIIADAARRMRGEGRGWRDVGVVLNLDDRDGMAAERAFEYVHGPVPDRWGTPKVTWRCDACGQHVTDFGPYAGNPTDNESGHADGCARHLREIAEFERVNRDG